MNVNYQPDLAEFLIRFRADMLDTVLSNDETVAYCARHGIVSHSHRCAVFDDMPWQAIPNMRAGWYSPRQADWKRTVYGEFRPE